MMLTQNSTTSTNNKLLGTYLDYVEETPNDIQKYLSKCREIDYKTTGIISEIEKLTEQISVSSGDKKTRLKVKLQSTLVKLMELKDEKIHLSQMLSASIENSYKSVVDSLQYNNLIKSERSPSPPPIKNNTNSTNNYNSNVIKMSTASNASSETNSASESQEKGSTKRARKTRIDNLEMDDDDDPLPINTSKSNNHNMQSASSIANKRASNANSSNKKVSTKKRKATKKQVAAQIPQETIDEVILDDPDETTYCICQQISYGEMVCCENDACPIEWFHFSCVELVSKPKGRWFCPQCRGDKPSVMNKNLRKKQQEANLL